MRKRFTLSELRWPSRPDVDSIRRAWTTDSVNRLLGFVWEGYDILRSEVLREIDLTQATDDLERSVTQALEPRIRRTMSGDEPFFVQHGRFEHLTRKAAPAQPPQYDLAFVHYGNENLCWPLEAKVLKHETDVSAYAREINDEFMTCRYAPLSAEGAMLGYLVRGDTETAFEAIGKAVPCALTRHLKFAARAHRVSEHSRTVPAGEDYSDQCRCHHLLMPLNEAVVRSR